MTDKHPFSTRRGRKLRALKLKADPHCEQCLRENKLTSAGEVHHRVPISQGGHPGGLPQGGP
jgi:hypothetical protein